MEKSLPSRVSRVVWRSLELEQTQALNKLPRRMITLALSSDRTAEKNDVFPGLGLLEKPPWSVHPRGHTAISGL